MKKLQDQTLGMLEWNEERKEWTGKINLPDNHIAEFSIDLENEEIPLSVKQTVEFIKNQEANIRKEIAEKMLSLHNEDWNSSKPITAEEFEQRIKLDGFNLSAEDGQAELFYDDDDLFWGHSIAVFVDCNGRIASPNLAG